MNFTILRFDSIDSTNTEALKHARRGAEEGLCIVAGQQTSGRGRQGREWLSPKDAGLYLSIVLRPKFDNKFLPLITLAAAIAVYDTLTTFALEPDIKWPNDILIDDKKVCGILAETTENGLGMAVVLGIGINVTSESFPSELADTATSIENELGRKIAINDLETQLLRSVNHWYSRLVESEGHSVIIDAWATRSTYFRGREVRVALTNDSITGVTDGLESNGALRIRQEDGEITVIQAGDVERLRQAKAR